MDGAAARSTERAARGAATRPAAAWNIMDCVASIVLCVGDGGISGLAPFGWGTPEARFTSNLHHVSRAVLHFSQGHAETARGARSRAYVQTQHTGPGGKERCLSLRLELERGSGASRGSLLPSELIQGS